MRLYSYLFLWNKCNKYNTTLNSLYFQFGKALMKPLNLSIKRTEAIAIAIDKNDIIEYIEDSLKDLNKNTDLVQRQKTGNN